MAVPERLREAGCDEPPGKPGGELERDVVGEPGADAEIFKFVAMHPAGEGACNLFVDKQPVFLVRGMQGDPAQAGDPEFHARANRDASALADDADRRKGGGEQLQCVTALVEREKNVYRYLDYDAADEERRANSFTVSKVSASPAVLSVR